MPCLVTVVASDAWEMLLLLCMLSWGTEATSVSLFSSNLPHHPLDPIAPVSLAWGSEGEFWNVATLSKYNRKVTFLLLLHFLNYAERSVLFSPKPYNTWLNNKSKRELSPSFFSGTQHLSSLLFLWLLSFSLSLENLVLRTGKIRYFSNSFVSGLDLRFEMLKIEDLITLPWGTLTL